MEKQTRIFGSRLKISSNPGVTVVWNASGALIWIAVLLMLHSMDHGVKAETLTLGSDKGSMTVTGRYSEKPLKALQTKENSINHTAYLPLPGFLEPAGQKPRLLSSLPTSISDIRPQRIVHIFWIGTRPLRAVGLATLDALAKHLSHANVTVHITVEPDIPRAQFANRRRTLQRQIALFRPFIRTIRLWFHGNVTQDLRETPLEGLPIEQRHIAGLWGKRAHPYLAAHATDFLRIAWGYRVGGLLMDDDAILTGDLEALFKRYGDAIMTTDHWDTALDRCEDIRLSSGFFALPRHHSMTKAYATYVKQYIQRWGPDCVFPAYDTWWPCGWDVIGPAALTFLHKRQWCPSVSPPLLVNHLSFTTNNNSLLSQKDTPQAVEITQPSFREDRAVFFDSGGHSTTSQMADKPDVHDGLDSYVVVSRKYLAPIYWRELSFLSSTRQYQKKITIITQALVVHMFGRPKSRLLDFLLEPEKYPILQYLHQRSCKALCLFETWKWLRTEKLVS